MKPCMASKHARKAKKKRSYQTLSKKQIEAVKSDRLNGQCIIRADKNQIVCARLYIQVLTRPQSLYIYPFRYTAKNYHLSRLLKTGCNNVVLPNNVVLRADSGSTMLNNIVDNYEQCGQHNIVASCFQQP